MIALIQTPFYLIALFFALEHYGLIGAAAVYLARNSVDYVMLAYAAGMIGERLMVLIATYAMMIALTVALQMAEPLSLVSGLGLGTVAALVAFAIGWRIMPEGAKDVARQFVTWKTGSAR